jgi:hypothetical protein
MTSEKTIKRVEITKKYLNLLRSSYLMKIITKKKLSRCEVPISFKKCITTAD